MPSTDPTEIPQVKDQRARIAGLLPRNTQALVLGGISLLMVLVILFSGHNAPKQRPTPTPTAASVVMEPNQARIQDYRTRIDEQMRRLAAEEAELAHSKQALGVSPNEAPPVASPMGTYGQSYGRPASPDRLESEKNWIERDRQKREYQSLYASNIALTYRHEAVLQSAAHQASATVAQNARADDPANPSDGASSVSQMPQYRLFEGTILETVLTNRLDSTFSGPINCLVTTNVYSHDGQKLLIPQGSRVLGDVKKVESFGEQRLAVLFHRLIMPDGFSISLDHSKDSIRLAKPACAIKSTIITCKSSAFQLRSAR